MKEELGSAAKDAHRGATKRCLVAGSTLALPGVDRTGLTTQLGGEVVWTQHLGRMKRFGFAAVDLVDTWLSPGEMSVEQLDALGSAFRRWELELVGISVIRKSIIDPADGERNLEHTLKSIEAAHRLGAPLVCIGFHRPLTSAQKLGPFWLVDGPRDDRSDENYALAGERLRSVCEHARTKGIAISLELYEGTLLDTGESALRVLAEAAQPNLGINPDLGNLYRDPRPLPETWLQTLEACLPAMNYWHVKNFTRVPVDGPERSITFSAWLDRGDIDYRTALDLASAQGYRGPICVEHYGGDALAAQAAGRTYLEDLLDSIEAEQRGDVNV